MPHLVYGRRGSRSREEVTGSRMDIHLSRLARPFVDLDFPGLVCITMGAGYFVRLRIALPEVDIPYLARMVLLAPTLSVPAHLDTPDGSERGQKLQKRRT